MVAGMQPRREYCEASLNLVHGVLLHDRSKDGVAASIWDPDPAEL